MVQKRDKIITIPTDVDKIYEQYLALLRPLYDISPTEKKIVIELMKLNVLYKDLDEGTRDIVFSSPKIKGELKEKSGLDTNYYNSTVSKLRQKGIMVDNNIIAGLRADLSGGIRIIYNLTI